MTPLEGLLACADERTLDLVREMVGRDRIALLISKALLANTTEALSPTLVAKALGMTPDGARKKTDNTALKTPSNRD